MPATTTDSPRGDLTRGDPLRRVRYTAPVLREYGSLTALTQTRTCAKGYNDGTGAGCSMSFKKS